MKKIIPFIIVLITLLSCDKDQVSIVDRIPSDALVVGKLNSQQFFKENALELLSTLEWSKLGEEYEVAQIGLDPLSNAYFYVSGSGVQDLQLNVLVELSNENKLKKWLTNNAYTVQEGELNFSFLGPKTSVAFDQDVAMWSYSLALPVVKEVCVRAFNLNSQGSEKPVSLEQVLASSAHLSLWIDSKKTVAVYKGAQQLLPLMGIQVPEVPYEASALYTVLEVNFTSGEIKLESTQYLSESQFMSQQTMWSNDLPTLLPNSVFTGTMAFLDLRLNPELVIKKLSENAQVRQIIQTQLRGYLSLSAIDTILDGRVAMGYNGMEFKTVAVVQPQLNKKTGEYEAIATPTNTTIHKGFIALGLKSKNFLERRFAFALANAKQEENWFRVSNDLEFFLDSNIFIVASDSAVIKQLKESVVRGNAIQGTASKPFNFKINIKDLLADAAKNPGPLQLAFQLLSNTFSNVYLVDSSSEKGLVKHAFKIEFQSKENSLLQLKTVVGKLKNSFQL